MYPTLQDESFFGPQRWDGRTTFSDFLVLMSNESAMLAGHLPSLLFGLPSLATPSFSLRAKVQKHKQLTRLVLWHALGALDFS